MSIETLGEAFSAGWRVRVRCAWGPREGMKRVRECVYGAELDLQTLVWTRGKDFPLDLLSARLKRPRCGSRRVRLAFVPPPSRAGYVLKESWFQDRKHSCSSALQALFKPPVVILEYHSIMHSFPNEALPARFQNRLG